MNQQSNKPIDFKQQLQINNRRDEISRFATEKFKLEQAGNPSIHTYAHIEPKTNFEVSQENKALDALARLIVSNEICSAVCCVGGELLIATNKIRPSYINKLNDYIKAPFQSQYQVLI